MARKTRDEVPRSLVFNRRRYIFSIGFETKARARRFAKERRKLGFQVRVVSFPGFPGASLYERGMQTRFPRG
ncbi:MAG: hypothetical protein ACUZ8A_06480 [Candidatus Bathyanammoxibius sp.]